ncbi:MAG: hypothetical protein JSU61_09560 [Fidelibacterota bacterium]|nr:MAG: hypothetical protein JSU61_09560 [Candidatus Neomarinimicrobiota bacterium]
MRRITLHQIASARSGDKGPHSNVGLIARSPEIYLVLKSKVTAERVKAWFGGIVQGKVIRYELDNLLALNFILGDSLGGGGSESLLNDAQGKTHGQRLLQMQISVPDDLDIPGESSTTRK